MNRLKETKTRYTLFGIGFGLLFPILATLLAIWQKGTPFTLQTALNAQMQNPVLWVVDLAPLVLAIVFRIIGQRESTLSSSNTQLHDTIEQLQEIQLVLEQRVQERTRELEGANAHIEKRARQFEGIIQIAQTVRDNQNLEEALQRVTNEINRQFGYHHAGIYLLDDKREYAILLAANSPGGKRMIEAGHRLLIGKNSLVGHVAENDTPRFVLDVGPDPVIFDNPDLPETHSQIALPLKSGGRVLGVLDIQSAEPSAFSNEDITILSVLADQIGILTENIRMFEATRASLEETVGADRQYIQREWTRLAREEKLVGFQYVDGNSTPLEVPLDLGEIAQIVHDGNIHQTEAGQDGQSAQLTVPVKLRGEVIGILHISMPKPHWTDDDIDIAEAVAERLALSMENARLFQSSANRATRERIVSDISSRIGGNIRMENILQTTAQELSQALGGSDVLIQLQAPKQPAEAQE